MFWARIVRTCFHCDDKRVCCALAVFGARVGWSPLGCAQNVQNGFCLIGQHENMSVCPNSNIGTMPRVSHPFFYPKIWINHPLSCQSEHDILIISNFRPIRKKLQHLQHGRSRKFQVWRFFCGSQNFRWFGRFGPTRWIARGLSGRETARGSFWIATIKFVFSHGFSLKNDEELNLDEQWWTWFFT